MSSERAAVFAAEWLRMELEAGVGPELVRVTLRGWEGEAPLVVVAHPDSVDGRLYLEGGDAPEGASLAWEDVIDVEVIE